MAKTITIELTDDESMVLYDLIREEFDSNLNSIISSDSILVSLAEKLDFPDLALQMKKDSDFGKTNIPQPPLPTGCITRQEWLRKIAGA